MFNQKIQLTQEQINTALEPMIKQIIEKTNTQMQENKEIMLNKITLLEEQVKQLIKEEVANQIKDEIK